MLHLLFCRWSFLCFQVICLILQKKRNMCYQYYPVTTFKEIEPTLKRCFNLDRNTFEIANCIFYSMNPQIQINGTIPEEYLNEEGVFDAIGYSLDHINKIIIPVCETFNTKNFKKFYKDYQLKVGTHFFDILFLCFYIIKIAIKHSLQI